MSSGGEETLPLMSGADLANSPSRRDGMSEADEKRARRKTCMFMEECGKALKLPKLPVMTAQSFLHRFFSTESFRQHDRFVVAQACIFLAAKVDEAPVKLQRVVCTCHAVREAARSSAPTLDPASTEYSSQKQKVLQYEAAVLYALKYDTRADNPLVHFIVLVKRLRERGLVSNEDVQNFAQSGTNFCSDSLRTTLCLTHEPTKIASVCAFLTIVLMRKLPTDKKQLAALFTIFSISQRSLNYICNEMIVMYLDMKRTERLVRDLAHMGHIDSAHLAKLDKRAAPPPPPTTAMPPPPPVSATPPPAPGHLVTPSPPP